MSEIQAITDTGMTSESIHEVVNGIATGIRARVSRARGFEDHDRDMCLSLDRIADALDYLVALSRRVQHSAGELPEGRR